MKIALLGSAPSSCQLAPFKEAAWEIWACSPQNHAAPRIDAWFELHSLDRKYVPGNEPYIATLEQHPRVYVSRADHRLPNGILYPFEEVYRFYGDEKTGQPLPFMDTYMQSSVSFMLAWAIMQKPDVIGLWGIDMAATDEYGQQRPGCQHFFNEAIKRGIEIVAPPQSDILEPLPLYAYKEHEPMYWRQKARKMELRGAITQAQAEVDRLHQEILVKQGALSDLEYTNNTYVRASKNFSPNIQKPE